MATFLDIGLIENFGVIFVILLVFLILFGLLEYMKAFGEGRRGLHALIALVVALLFLVSKVATAMAWPRIRMGKISGRITQVTGARPMEYKATAVNEKIKRIYPERFSK